MILLPCSSCRNIKRPDTVRARQLWNDCHLNLSYDFGILLRIVVINLFLELFLEQFHLF